MSRILVHRRLNRTPPPSYRLLVMLAAVSLFSVVGCSTALVGGLGTGYAVVSKDLPNPTELANRPLAQVTQLYDRTGEHLLYEFYEERRIAIPLREVASIMIQATLAAEDVSFWQHRGFDVRGLTRAFLGNIRSGTIQGGGSTVTQQLVKLTLIGDEVSYLRKLRELILAIRVESIYSKEQILEMYLNQVYYGNQAYGVEAAALSYFGKHAKDLNLAEASLLAGLVQRPSVYDPVNNPKAALNRQGDILDVMVRYDMISQEEADAAQRQAAGFTYRQQQTNIIAPHFAFFVKEQLQQRVNPEVVRSGLKVITTIDLDVQNRAQEIVARRVRELRYQRVNNGSLVAIDPKTGEILAMVGSADYYNQDIDGQVNVATARRQPGSSFKPFTYATVFAGKKWVPSSTVADRPIQRPDPSSRTGFYRPVNYDLRWHGVVTLRSALANSYNIPALLVQEAVGTKEVIKMARTLGINTDLPEVVSLTLGAGVVRLLDMTSAYGVFANGGVRVEPTPFQKIVDSHGNTVFELSQPKGEQVIAPEVAYMITDILADNAARRPMFGSVLDLAGGRVAAVKTGTTNDYKDSLTIGYTPSLVAGVWVGNTDNSPMLQVAGSLGAGYIWKEFMDTTFKGRPIERFEVPSGATRGRICSGTDLFMPGTTPTCSVGAGAYTVTSAGAASSPAARPPTPRPTPVLPPR
ncbi:MAG: PBP1A family penicillin-binding protein [Chloroflexi bacterium]|nr:PBP1A family penicillin-binding protein [Chloroflexota bacterium]